MKNKFITSITLFSFIFVTLFSPFPAPTHKAYAEDTSSLRIVTGSNTVFSFKKDLMQGDTDPDVKELQKILNKSINTKITDSGPGSPGQETTYFGELTKKAVIKFQEKHRQDILVPNNIPAGNGIVGIATRSKLNSLLGITTPTVASVGLPQSRAGSTNTTPVTTYNPSNTTVLPAQTTVNTVSQPQMSVCQFVELLINIGAIAPNKADAGRRAFNCIVDINKPSVDVKVDGSQGPVTVLPGTEIRIHWTSTNTKSCSDGVNNIPKNGYIMLKAETSLSYPVSCLGKNGESVVDAVTVMVSGGQTNATSTITIISSSIVPAYNSATFNAVTNIPTKMFVSYTNQPTVESSVKVYESATSTTHANKITGLVPNSTYYARVAFSAGPNNTVMSDELVFTTLANDTSFLDEDFNLDFNFPAVSDTDLSSEVSNLDEEEAGYEISFKGGIKSVRQSSGALGPSLLAELETCDNPTEDLVKSVTVIGDAPSRDPSYYNTRGRITVLIPSGGLFDIGTPSERDTFVGTSRDIISGPGANQASTVGAANSGGMATSWNKQAKSCIKPPDDDGFLGMGDFAIVGAIVGAVVLAVVCTACLTFMASALPGGAAIGTGATAMAVGTAGAGLTAFSATTLTVAASAWAGSSIECEDGSTGCY
jgi:peptidoglycan hydrolase-like protein with peptidoglycan-binding domain